MINDVAAKSTRGRKSQGRMRQGSLLSARCIPSQIITKIMMSIVKSIKTMIYMIMMSIQDYDEYREK